MARQGATIHNRRTGETITWLETAADTGGKRLKFRLEVEPGARLPVTHFHPGQHESFAVETGTLVLKLETGTVELTRDKGFTVAPGVRHTWWNPSATEPAAATITFEPALNTETFLEQFFGLGNEGRAGPDGTPYFLQIMAMVNEYQLYIAGPPIGVQKMMGFVLGGFARLLGYRKFYARYSS